MMNKYVELGIKGVIISSSMITTNEVLGTYDMCYGKNGNKLATKIAGSTLGFVIGRRVANECVKIIKAAIIAYNGEDEING